MNKTKILAFTLGILVLAVFGILISYLQAQVFVRNPVPQRTLDNETPADYGLDYEAFTITSKDNYNISGWYIPSQNGAAVILQHGYKGNRADMLPLAKIFAGHGYGLIMIDLRAHGKSDGEVISFGLHEVQDIEAAYQYLLTRTDVDPERIGALGVSMGGVVVILHAAQNQGIKAIAANSAFASLQDEVPLAVAGTGLPAFLIAPLVQRFAEQTGGFDAQALAAVDHIGKLSPRPVFLMQGGADMNVPFDSGRRLYDAAGEPRELWFEPELGHTIFGFAQPEEFERRVVKGFFDQYLLDGSLNRGTK